MFKALLKLIFLWLVLNDDILTWDNLWKKALEGSRPLPTLQRKFWKCKTSLHSIPFHQGNLGCGQINLWWERDLGRCICLRGPGRLAKGPEINKTRHSLPVFVLWTFWLVWNEALFQDTQFSPQDYFYDLRRAYFSFEESKKKNKQKRIDPPGIDSSISFGYFDSTANRNPNVGGSGGILDISPFKVPFLVCLWSRNK